MATGTIKSLGKKIISETRQVSVTQGQNYCYVNAKTGYNLISAIFNTSWSGDGDSIVSIAWSGYNYIIFMKGAPSASETRNIILTWCEN